MARLLLILGLLAGPALSWGQRAAARPDSVPAWMKVEFQAGGAGKQELAAPDTAGAQSYHWSQGEQYLTPLDSAPAARVITEHSRAGEYAMNGALMGTFVGALGRIAILHFDRSWDLRSSGTQVALSAGICATGGAILGAIIGLGERWTEAPQGPAKVGLVPLEGGAMVMMQVSP